MRIKKVRTNYRASGILRRDARHQKNPEDDTDRPRVFPSSRKNTRRWCLGRVGREHDPARVVIQILPYPDSRSYYQYACRKCGKTLDSYFPGFSPLFRSRELPDWMK